ncbi:MAG: hypothetical protein M0Z85_02390 [Gammaproteobacteria bacterium]|nr:hypothetical protein [Gammaproteobacteria bacterium]
MTELQLWGSVPQHWRVLRNRFVFRERNERDFVERPLVAVSQRHGVIGKRDLEALEGRKLSGENDDLSSYKRVEPGDIVYNKMRMWQGAVGVSEMQGIASPAYVVATPMRGLDGRFAAYLLKSEPYVFQSGLLSYGICDDQNSLRWEDFANLKTPLPPPGEQTRIANFLDEQTARIDALIAEKERLDALLGEYRGSLISAAVMGQLDPATWEASCRAQGGGGRVSSWSTVRLRYVADLNPSVRADLLQAPDTEVSFLPMEAIGENGSLSLDRTRPVAEVRNGYSYFENGDIAFAKVTPCFENGKGALMRGLEHAAGFGTTELTVLRPKLDANPNFLNYVLQSSRFRQLGAAAMTGAGGLKRVPDEFTKDFETVWPVSADQACIANFLDEQTARIDDLRNHCREHVALLREYRSSLISAAVTGQLDMDGSKSCLS